MYYVCMYEKWKAKKEKLDMKCVGRNCSETVRIPNDDDYYVIILL